MRHQNKEYLEALLREHGPFARVLDVGSLHVNDNVRYMFPDGTYTGVDMRKGDNVDIVLNGHDLLAHFGKDQFDLVICFDTFEHDDAFWLTVKNMRGVLKPGGWMIIAAPSFNCPEHDHPHDYWRFLPQSFNLFFDAFEHVAIKVDHDTQGQPADEIIGWGRKGGI